MADSIDFVTALARLLSNATLRAKFIVAPNSVADELNVASLDRSAFVALDPSELEEQATVMINKRWHEVERLIPKTVEGLGTSAQDMFRFFANQDWPTGHRRHPEDALRFIQFIEANKLAKPNQKELARLRQMTR